MMLFFTISNIIPTYNFIVMGYAAQIEEDKTLPADRQRQAGVIRVQRQMIRE